MPSKSDNAAEAGFAQPRLRLVSGSLAVAAAIWLLPASIHIVKWPASGPVRLAFLAPVWQLAALIALALLASGLLLWRPASARGGSRRSAWHTTVVDLLGRCWPLWLWTVPYLPWLSDALPLTLILAGPARYGILGWVLGRTWTDLPIAHRLRDSVVRVDRRTVFAASLVFFLAAGLYSARRTELIGDEPAYLVIVESLLRDGDLKIENNHQRGDYRTFHPDPLPPDYVKRGKNGAIYSVHAPGLPALLVPSYALLGRTGVVAMLALMAAFAALAVFDLALALTDRKTALLTWAATGLTVPFVPHAWLIFPELPGLLITAWAALWTWQSTERRPWLWVAYGGALGILPWLHTKFIILSAVFGAAAVIRLRTRPRALAAFLGPTALLSVFWFVSFYMIYGTFNPAAPYGDSARTEVLLKNIPHGVVGLLFDQKYGLLVYSPFYLVAAVGAWAMLKQTDRRWYAVTLIGAIAAFTASTTRYYMFWGGASAPARFLVPLVACLAPLLAVGIQSIGSVWVNALLAVAVVWSVAIAATGVLQPDAMLFFSDPHGRARLLEFVEEAFPLSWMVPTFTEPDWVTQVPRLLAVIAVAATAAAMAFAFARVRGMRTWEVGALFVLGLVIGGAIVSSAPGAAVRVETARRGAISAIWRLDDGRRRPFDYEALQTPSNARLRRLAAVDLPTAALVAPASGISAGPVGVPAGEYELVLWFNRSAPGNGEVVVGTTPENEAARLVGALGNPTRMLVTLPLGAGRLDVRVADAALASSVNRIEIVPIKVHDWERPRAAARATEGLASHEGAYLGYLDDDAYPEGGVFWTRGTGEAQFLIVPAGASRLKLVLSTGPMSGNVRVSVAGEQRTITTVGGEGITTSFELPRGLTTVPVSVQSDVMFVPKMTDAGSDDNRALGCQVRVLLE